jgi:hypothetical protein
VALFSPRARLGRRARRESRRHQATPPPACPSIQPLRRDRVPTAGACSPGSRHAGVRHPGHRLPLLHLHLDDAELAMDAAAAQQLRFVVLDRPNPIGGVRMVEARCSTPTGETSSAAHRIPLRHGMTAGELAKRMFAAAKIAVQLDVQVVPSTGWQRPTSGIARASSGSTRRRTCVRLTEALLYPRRRPARRHQPVGRPRHRHAVRSSLGAPWLDGVPRRAASARSQEAARRDVRAGAFTPTASKFAANLRRRADRDHRLRRRSAPVRTRPGDLACATARAASPRRGMAALDKLLKLEPAACCRSSPAPWPSCHRRRWTKENSSEFRTRRKRVPAYP